MANRFTNKELAFNHFLQKAKEIWGEEYDYSKFNYTKALDKWVGKYDNGNLYLKKQLNFINGDDLTQDDFELLNK